MTPDRYERHRLIEWFDQDKVRSSHVAVVGAGAVGNEVIKNLVLLGVGEISIYDFDLIEIHNLTRSILFTEADIGKSKAAVAAERARAIDKNVQINHFHGDVWQLMRLDKMRQYQAVISAVDNFEARIRINNLCRLAGVDLVNAGIDSRYASVETFPFRTTPMCACYECSLPESVYKKVSSRYSCGWLKKIGIEERKIPTTVITSSVAGAFAASLALRLNVTTQSVRASRTLIDTISGESSVTDLSRSPTCVGCSEIRKSVHIYQVDGSKPVLRRPLIGDDFPNVRIRLSDPVITKFSCSSCHQYERHIFECASGYTEALTICPSCNAQSVKVDIRDSFTYAELGEYVKDRTVPTKYASMHIGDHTFIFELAEAKTEEVGK
jgi:molybdopterin/thiamine biosynthesis adenylyltransferase